MEELIKALETIKAECVKRPNCKATGCPFMLIEASGLSCGIRNSGTPSSWKIGEPKVFTTLLR